ncbi:carbohydrate ABC transporter permease [Ktedonospora formicarum]|uniref:Sugar ABC transporter permease n=1 Tax=Ktedonospora formicarum TaxID=2778364 RepID=A0A8J3MPJ8_9CHLR|nr:sugar ABC transporter permease [Ktedonospora formicarum]GHO42985.1 sugar ABC transporter permease [Ktedonospora formicarum]
MDVSSIQAKETSSKIESEHKKRGRTGRVKQLEAREARSFWLLISPWIIGFIAFTGLPIIASLFLSFTDYTGTALAPTFTGLANYQALFEDPVYLKSIGVSTYYTILLVPLSVVCSLLLALLLNQRVRFQGIFRTIFYMPSFLPGVAVSLLWVWILSPNFGLANYILNLLHLPSSLWLQDENTVIPSFVLMALWSIGGPMVVFLASLQGIPSELYEAAALDGSNGWHKFISITVPMLSPAILLNLITSVIAAFQIFVPAYVVSNSGSGVGPNYSAQFYVLYLFNNAFQYFKFGYAAAQALILFIIILLLTILLLWGSRRFVYYES